PGRPWGGGSWQGRSGSREWWSWCPPSGGDGRDGGVGQGQEGLLERAGAGIEVVEAGARGVGHAEQGAEGGLDVAAGEDDVVADGLRDPGQAGQGGEVLERELGEGRGVELDPRRLLSRDLRDGALPHDLALGHDD